MHEQVDKAAPRILVIEDDRFIGEMYVRSLRTVGYKVDWLTEGDKGLEAALTGKYNLILLDIMLPEKMGNAILHDLKTPFNKIPDTRIIVMTNFEQDDSSRHAMETNADAYLIKADITPRRMLEVVKQVLA
jgi:DNA-binding response OmpR family regulator